MACITCCRTCISKLQGSIRQWQACPEAPACARACTACIFHTWRSTVAEMTPIPLDSYVAAAPCSGHQSSSSSLSLRYSFPPPEHILKTIYTFTFFINKLSYAYISYFIVFFLPKEHILTQNQWIRIRLIKKNIMTCMLLLKYAC